MLHKTAFIALAILLTGGVLGCATQQESLLDKNWGRSFEAQKVNQTLNPDAGENLEPVEGMPGPAAERILSDYHTGGEKAQQQSSGVSVFTMGK
jgi:hypothetical protein